MPNYMQEYANQQLNQQRQAYADPTKSNAIQNKPLPIQQPPAPSMPVPQPTQQSDQTALYQQMSDTQKQQRLIDQMNASKSNQYQTALPAIFGGTR